MAHHDNCHPERLANMSRDVVQKAKAAKGYGYGSSSMIVWECVWAVCYKSANTNIISSNLLRELLCGTLSTCKLELNVCDSHPVTQLNMFNKSCFLNSRSTNFESS